MMTSEEKTTRSAGGLVHGMGRELCAADWPPLTDEEVRAVLARFERRAESGTSRDAFISWHSPRPMSAAAIVRFADGEVFVKRHHVAVRTPERLVCEHQYAGYVRAWGQPLPRVLRDSHGDTVVQDGDFVYEVHEMAMGVDLYRDVPSWHSFASLGHARAAGLALARFHRSARSFPLPSSAPGILSNSVAIVASADPLTALARLVAVRPGLARSISRRSLLEDFTRCHLRAIEKAAPLLGELRPQWGHGDWHPSNLTWTSTGPNAVVAGVLDLGLANRTFAVHDLAVALERGTVDWLDLSGTGHIAADLEAVDALLDGYEEVQPLNEIELAALVAVLPVVHLEYALSEVEYFAEVVRSPTNADLAYDGYFIGHTRWFEEPAGSMLLGQLQRRAQRR